MIQRTPFFLQPSKAELRPRNDKAPHSGIFTVNIPFWSGLQKHRIASKIAQSTFTRTSVTNFGNSGLFIPICLRSQPSCHTSLKFAGDSNLLNGDILKMSNLKLSQPGMIVTHL